MAGFTRPSLNIQDIAISILFTFYAATQAISLKKQIGLNLKYAETPWYYISILELNKAIPEQKDNQYVISSIAPYLVDFYSNGNYRILPLSPHQEFRNDVRQVVWGYEFTYGEENYHDMYTSLLKSGATLYAEEYGLGNEGTLHNNWEMLNKDFTLTQIHEACFSACNVYRVELKQ